MSSASNDMNLSDAARNRAVENYLNVRYTPDRRPYTPYPNQLTRHLFDTYIKGHKYKNLLDVGCGRGDFLHGFAECGLDVRGVDNSLYSDRPFKEPITVADIEGKKLPFEDNSYDVVFSKSVIEHIHNTDVFVAENFRVTRPGGVSIVLVPDWTAMYKCFYDDYTHVRPFTKMGLEDAYEAHGFKIRDSVRFRQLPFVWKNPALHLYCDLLTMLPDSFKKYKTVKFSKEWMLLLIAEKPVTTSR